MSSSIPSFSNRFPALDRFVHELAQQHETGALQSWDQLDTQVKAFFTPDQMEHMESVLPGWRKMSSYLDGVTLTHVMCVFLGLYRLPEFQCLDPDQQSLLKWAVLLHDLEKEVQKGKRDPVHAFHSAVTAAQRLPGFGFPVTDEFAARIAAWSESTLAAVVQADRFSEPIQDNHKLPEILSGIEAMFGRESMGSQIVKVVLLHMSVNVVSEWPQAAPLTDEEIVQLLDPALVSLLRVMMLADNEGWGMFSPEIRQRERNETLQTFTRLERMIA